MLLRISIKTFGLLAFILFVFTANATNYYLSTSGNDANSGMDPSSPWQTLNKLNSFKNLKPGDDVLFNRGDTFYGSITISNSGTAGNPITFGAYGTGENPIITGFTNVTKWTNLGNNIWESTDPVSTLSTCNMVVINGVNTAMGRWPNSGYLTFQSHTGKSSISSNNLTGSPNWSGAEIVIRSSQWTLDRVSVASQIEGELSYYPTLTYEPTDGFGFFLQNDPRTLDQQNEWYYNPSTKKLMIYSIGPPQTVQVASQNILATIHGAYLNFNELSFVGTNSYGFYNDWSGISNLNIENCSILFSGIDAIKLANCKYFKLEKSTLSNSHNNAVNLFYLDPYDTIRNNIIQNTGIFAGMGQSGTGTYSGIVATDLIGRVIIEYNKITNIGYNGITFRGDSVVIRNNFIDTICTILQDGGGIYTGRSGYQIYSGRKIQNNIILNAIGATSGTNSNSYTPAEGIYIDEVSEQVEVSGNSIANCARHGIFLHNANDITVFNNTVYNCAIQLGLQQDQDSSHIKNNIIKNNFLIAKFQPQFALSYVNFIAFPIDSLGIIDSNYYARPIDDNLSINIYKTIPSYSYLNYNLSGWQAYSGKDMHSKVSPKNIINENDLRFECNPSTSIKTIILDANYMDVTGATYNGFITLAPYCSVVLIKNGPITNQPPKANAGPFQIITIPSNSINLSGSGTDTDGTINTYFWTKISGPSAYNISNLSSAVTTASGLIEGVYLFELKVTDDKGAVGRDTVQITVNPAANLTPTANAGSDKIIILPTNSVSLSGSGTDSDGTVSSYSWAKISGPLAYNFSNSASVVTRVSELVHGVYLFELRVTDNKGAIGRDTVQVTVNAALNIPPTANAGANQTITLPINTITISGSATDTDGTISSYLWTKISGPSSGTINNANSAYATINGLSEGTYQFELKVTDDKGAVGRDTVQITANAAPTIAPTANAGANQTITLPINTAILSGSGTDSDGTISSYLWTKISGPSSGTINNANSAYATINGLT
jgi:hypothetical protein